MNYKLFSWAASRYDLHTPPTHYQHDHQFVLNQLATLPPRSRLLDVGCGTGVFLEKAKESLGLEVFGIDVADAMVEIANSRIGEKRVSRLAMQELSAVEEYDAIVSLSWSFNYCESESEAQAVLGRFHSALRPNGRLILQVAHCENATGKLCLDTESGPNSQAGDVMFFYRFSREEDKEKVLVADYVYACFSLSEILSETHRLHVADVYLVKKLAEAVGFESIRVFGSWKADEVGASISPFLFGVRR